MSERSKISDGAGRRTIKLLRDTLIDDGSGHEFAVHSENSVRKSCQSCQKLLIGDVENRQLAWRDLIPIDLLPCS